jgi:septation ring formation regulator EzrA
VVYEIVSEYLVPWIVRKRAELSAEKRRREFIEEENRRNVEENERREQRRRNVRIYQIVLAVAAIVIVANFVSNELTSNRNLLKKLKAANEQIESLQKTGAEQKMRIQELEAQLGSVDSRLEAVRRTNQGLNESLRTTQLTAQQTAEQAETERADFQRRLRNALARATPPQQPNTTTTATSTQP